MADITSTYPPGFSKTVVSGGGFDPTAALHALLSSGPPAAGPSGGRMMGPRMNLARKGPKSQASERGSNVYVDPGFKKKKIAGLGFNMTPGYVDDEPVGSAGFASAPGPSPAGLSPSAPPAMPGGGGGDEERPDFFGTGTTSLRAQQALLAARARGA